MSENNGHKAGLRPAPPGLLRPQGGERVVSLVIDISVSRVDFETQRDHDRRELAERFANQRQTRTGAINELAALLDAEDELDRLAAEAIETARTEDFVISGRIRID